LIDDGGKRVALAPEFGCLIVEPGQRRSCLVQLLIVPTDRGYKGFPLRRQFGSSLFGSSKRDL